MRLVIFAVLALFAAVTAHAQGGYKVAAGDRLTIEVLEDPALNREVVVLPDGTVSFPFAGTVPVAGRTVSQIQSTISGAIAPNFAAQPNVFVSVAAVEPRIINSTGPTIDVYFLGEVNTPGTQAVPRGTTFLQALALSGGLSPYAADKRVQLRRINPKTGQSRLVVVNYRALTRGGDLARDVVLADGDVILVPSRGLFE